MTDKQSTFGRSDSGHFQFPHEIGNNSSHSGFKFIEKKEV